VAEDGLPEGPRTIPSAGATPYGFDFTSEGTIVVTEAFGGEVGAAAASSYRVTPGAISPVTESVRNGRSEVCWAVVAHDNRHAYVTNFGDGTISSYRIADDGSIELFEEVAASTRLGEKGVRDEGLTRDGRFLYAIDADAPRVFGWAVGGDGRLTPVGEFEGVPETVAGLAAS
jgi:6-phosphogluconolactonase